MNSPPPPRQVTIVEVGPRDGLQNEKVFVPTPIKNELIQRLHSAGVTSIEITSFVSSKWVPQMADNREVCENVDVWLSPRRDLQQQRFIALTPNLKGFDQLLQLNQTTKSQIPNVAAVFTAASEGFSKANTNCSIEESLQRFQPIMKKAQVANIPIRGYISCVIACPYDGVTSPNKVAQLAGRLKEMGCYEISLGDTIGAGNPETTLAMLQAVLNVLPPKDLALHFHDTGKRALENIRVGLDLGIRTVDSSIGGLGGCPYAGPGASGNVATEAVVNMLHRLGYETGTDLTKLNELAEWIQTFIKTCRSSAEKPKKTMK